MVDLPLNSPIDIRAHILYYAYQRYSIKKSYSNYKKLCIKFGKQAISFEEYEFLFMQYLGVDERELPDIRGCILSNVINGKSAEKSIDDLCDAFKNHKIDKEDHDYWHRRFENGHLFTRVTFSDFPEDVISEIVERCDIKSYLNLRNVSHGFRTVIDQQPPPCTHIQVHCGGDRMKIYVDYALIADSDNHYSNLRMKAFLKRMHGSLTLLLRNSKLRLKYFAFYANAASRETYLYTKVVISLLNSLNRKIHVERCLIRVESESDLIRILQCFKPGTLGKIEEYSNFPLSNQIAEMDQWKQAKNLVLEGYFFPPIGHLLHFSTIEFRYYSNSLEDVIKLCEVILKNISNWINFTHFKIGTGYILDTKTIKRVLNLQPTASPQIYTIPNSNLVIQFKRGNRYSNSLKITKK